MVIVKKIFSSNFTGAINKDSVKIFIKNSKWHRYYGPAYKNTNYKQWWFNDKCYGDYGYNYNVNYNQKHFFKDLGKEWLL